VRRASGSLEGGWPGASRTGQVPHSTQPSGAGRDCCGCGTLAARNRAGIDRRSKPRAAVQECVGSLMHRSASMRPNWGQNEAKDRLKLASPREGANRCFERAWLEARQSGCRRLRRESVGGPTRIARRTGEGRAIAQLRVCPQPSS